MLHYIQAGVWFALLIFLVWMQVLRYRQIKENRRFRREFSETWKRACASSPSLADWDRRYIDAGYRVGNMAPLGADGQPVER